MLAEASRAKNNRKCESQLSRPVVVWIFLYTNLFRSRLVYFPVFSSWGDWCIVKLKHYCEACRMLLRFFNLRSRQAGEDMQACLLVCRFSLAKSCLLFPTILAPYYRIHDKKNSDYFPRQDLAMSNQVIYMLPPPSCWSARGHWLFFSLHQADDRQSFYSPLMK